MPTNFYMPTRIVAGAGALDEIASLVADGRVRVPIAARYPLERIREAVEVQADRHVRGKIVIEL